MNWNAIVSRLSLEGVTREHLVLTIGLAVLLGVCPMYGFPTLLCVLAALTLRLNFAAMQMVNVVTSPLQLALLVPFHRLGSLLLGGTQASVHPWAPGHSHVWHFFLGLWVAAIHAFAGWICVSAPLTVLLFFWLVGRNRGLSRAVDSGSGKRLAHPPDPQTI